MFSSFSWLQLRFPFDSKNLLGYLVAIVLLYYMIFDMFFVIASMLSLGIGAFILAISSTMQIRRYMNLLSKHAISKKNLPKKTLQLLTDFVDFHSDVKQLSENDLCATLTVRVFYAIHFTFFNILLSVIFCLLGWVGHLTNL